MSVREIEFIPTEDIKPQDLDFQRTGETITSFPDANYLRAYRKRYGEIFMDCPQRLLLICSFCDEVHACMEKFGKHIREKHVDDELKGDVDVLDIKTETEAFSNETNGQDSTGVEKLISINKWDLRFLDSDDVENIASETVNELIPSKEKRKSTARKEPDATNKSDKKSLNASDDSCGNSDNDYDYTPKGLKAKKSMKPKKTKKTQPTTRPRKEVEPVTVTDPALFCRECNRQYQKIKPFRLHIETVHEGKTDPTKSQKNSTQCKYCDQEFPTHEQLKEHKRTHDRKRPFQCPHCPMSFKCNNSRQGHINKHFGRRPHKCTECPKTFAAVQTLRHHLLRAHEILTPGADGKNPQLKCDYCGLLFITMKAREVHMRSHTGEKPFQCELCGQGFRTNGRRREHMKRHNNERNYECHICGKKFYDDRLRNNHLVVHSTEKPFECQDCGKTFSRKLTLKLHQKIHSDVYQYSCDICGKQFKQSSGLYCHKKTHGCIIEKEGQRYADGTS